MQREQKSFVSVSLRAWQTEFCNKRGQKNGKGCWSSQKTQFGWIQGLVEGQTQEKAQNGTKKETFLRLQRKKIDSVAGPGLPKPTHVRTIRPFVLCFAGHFTTSDDVCRACAQNNFVDPSSQLWEAISDHSPVQGTRRVSHRCSVELQQ